MKRLVKLTISMAVLAWLLIPSSGYAQRGDTKFFPGASCQPFDGAQASGLQSHPAFILNFSEEGRLVTCPIVRDSERNARLFIQAAVRSQNTQALTCIAFGIAPFGNIVEAVSNVTSNNFPTLLTWTLGSRDAVNSTLLCLLPSGGRIFDYVVTETEIE